MPAMQVSPRHCQQSQPWAVLPLWLATLLFVFQVGVHVAMPQHMNMAEMVGDLFAPPTAVTMPGMSLHHHPESPARPAKHAAEGLCCMTPAAVLPVLWTPPAPLLIRETQAPPRALREALLRLRATARGPPQD